MADQRYINLDSAGGDGTTNNTSGGTAAYASAESWESNEETTLTDNHIVNASSPSGVADSRFTIDGWITTDTFDVEFIGDNNALVFNNTDKYHIAYTPSANFQYGIYVRDDYIIISGVQVHTDTEGAYTSIRAFYADNRPGLEFKDCGAYNTSGTRFTGSNNNGFECAWGPYPTYISNCVARGYTAGTKTNFQAGTESSTNYVYYNIAYDCGTGFNIPSGTARIRNNIGFANGTDFSASGGWPDYNLSDDATAAGTNSVINATVAFISTTTGSEDFHLANDSTDAAGAGDDLDADAYYPISVDADGDTRHATAPDIGADEFVGGAPPAGAIINQLQGSNMGADLFNGTLL